MLVATGVLVLPHPEPEQFSTERETPSLWEEVRAENKSLSRVIQIIFPDLAEDPQGGTSTSLQEPLGLGCHLMKMKLRSQHSRPFEYLGGPPKKNGYKQPQTAKTQINT